MKALVTGGTGFVGSALVRQLLKVGYDVRVLLHYKKNKFILEGLNVEIVNGDVTRPAAVDKAVKGCDVVFDVASAYVFYPFWEKEAKALYKINVQGTINLLNASLKHGVKRYIHTSSIATVGKNLTGKASDETTPFDFKSASHYARSKYLAEQEVLRYCKKGLAATILNPAIILGERDNKPTPSGDVIVKFLNRSFPGYFETIWSIADVDDVAKAHVAAIAKGKIGERYILCHKQHLHLKEIYQRLERISGIKAPSFKIPLFILLGFVYVDEFLSHTLFRKQPLLPSEGLKFCMMSIQYDNSKAVRELDYATKPITETLAKAVTWYRKNGYVAPRGVLRIKANGLRCVRSIMKFLKMDKLTDKLNLGTLSYYSIVKLLQFLQGLGVKPPDDGWRKVAQCYLRTEQAKFALTVFGLKYRSDLNQESALSAHESKRHAILRLQEFLRDHPATHCKIHWKAYACQKQYKKEIDIVYAESSDRGVLKKIVPYLDIQHDNQRFKGISLKQREYIMRGIILNYNKTKSKSDIKRPKLLRNSIFRWLKSNKGPLSGNVDSLIVSYVDSILSATFIHFKKISKEDKIGSEDRYAVPDFIKFKHPGFGLMNIIGRFTPDYREIDLWVQYNHIPIDGVPAQEILNKLKRAWGQSKSFTFPDTTYKGDLRPKLAATQPRRNDVYQVSCFVDFQPFLKLRRALNRRCGQRTKGTITTAALLIWKLSQFPEFEDIKFTIPIDLKASRDCERTLGFIFIRPAVYLNNHKPDRGFFEFQREFNRQLRNVRKRTGEGHNYLQSLALAPPWMYAVTAKVLGRPLRDFGGTLGITIIKKADYFIAPYSDVHKDGFIAFSSYSLPTAEGDRVGLVSIKGPRHKVQRYMRVINEVMNYSVIDDELYF